MSKPGTASPPVTDRITVSLIPKAAGSLAALRDRTGLSKTDLVNRAVILYDCIDAEIAAGSEVVLRSADGTTRVLKLL